ncbi:MAG: amidohydrolase [Lacisediminihabitans sp.]
MSTIFTNGRYFDSGTGSRVGSVAVVNGRIAAIGGLEKARTVAGSHADEVDLQGGLLSPGFIDAHFHPMMGGLERSMCDLGSATSARDCVEIVSAFAQRNPAEAWIVGGGWRLDLFPGGVPTRHELDAVVPDRPVILRSADRHVSWVNSRALEIAGVTAHTPDPDDGRVVRDSQGNPSGIFYEGGIALIERASPAPSQSALKRGLMVAQEYALSLGITGWQDALLRVQQNGVDSLDAYLEAISEGGLKVKVTGALWWDRTRGLEQLPELVARRRRAEGKSDRFRADSIKIMLDGIPESFTALLSHPYHDGHGNPTNNSGIRHIDTAALRQIVRALDAEGFQMHFHAIGDQAVRESLDALAELPGNSDLRHHLAHLQVVNPEDVRRFAGLTATANIQPLWAQNEPVMTDLTLPFLDPSLWPWVYPFGDLARANAHLAAGSDWPVSDANPLAGMHVAVNRSSHASSAAGPFIPEQAMSLQVIWDAYTSGSAWTNHRETTTGAIRVGAAADLAVIDRDPFSNSIDHIERAIVTGTWIDGEQVWARGA